MHGSHLHAPDPDTTRRMKRLAPILLILCACCGSLPQRLWVQGVAATAPAAIAARAGRSNSTTGVQRHPWLLIDEVLHGSVVVSDALLQQQHQQQHQQHQQQQPSTTSDPAPVWPPSSREAILWAVVLFTLLLAAGGGIGGGAVFVPVLILLGGFTTGQAVALSNVTVLGGAAANLAINLRRRHPHRPRPLIDWDLILVMEPATILGALLGSYLNKLLPVWITSIMLAALLCLITLKLAARAAATHRAESAAAAALLLRQQGTNDDDDACREPLLGPPHVADVEQQQQQQQRRQQQHLELEQGAAGPPDPVALKDDGGGAPLLVPLLQPPWDDDPEALASRLEALHRLEARQLPRGPLAVLLGLAGAVVATDTYKSALPCGSWRYWLLVASIVPVCGATTLAVRRHLLRKARLKALLRPPPPPPPPQQQQQQQQQRAGAGSGDVQWDARNTLLYPCVCSTAGVVAGLFGVGGGIVKSPLMLELGVEPQVAAATSSTMIAFTAGSACVVYLDFGGIVWSYAAPLFAAGVLVTLAGQWGTSCLVRLAGRKSVIVFVMSSLMALSTVAALYQAAANWRAALRHPDQMWHGGRICKHS